MAHSSNSSYPQGNTPASLIWLLEHGKINEEDCRLLSEISKNPNRAITEIALKRINNLGVDLGESSEDKKAKEFINKMSAFISSDPQKFVKDYLCLPHFLKNKIKEKKPKQSESKGVPNEGASNNEAFENYLPIKSDDQSSILNQTIADALKKECYNYGLSPSPQRIQALIEDIKESALLAKKMAIAIVLDDLPQQKACLDSIRSKITSYNEEYHNPNSTHQSLSSSYATYVFAPIVFLSIRKGFFPQIKENLKKNQIEIIRSDHFLRAKAVEAAMQHPHSEEIISEFLDPLSDLMVLRNPHIQNLKSLLDLRAKKMDSHIREFHIKNLINKTYPDQQFMQKKHQQIILESYIQAIDTESKIWDYFRSSNALIRAIHVPGNELGIHFLIEQGADIRFRNENGKTLFHLAAEIPNNKENIECLSQKNAINVNERDHGGKTALHRVIMTHKQFDKNLQKSLSMIEETIVTFLKIGADPLLKDAEGNDVLDEAVQFNILMLPKLAKDHFLSKLWIQDLDSYLSCLKGEEFKALTKEKFLTRFNRLAHSIRISLLKEKDLIRLTKIAFMRGFPEIGIGILSSSLTKKEDISQVLDFINRLGPNLMGDQKPEIHEKFIAILSVCANHNAKQVLDIITTLAYDVEIVKLEDDKSNEKVFQGFQTLLNTLSREHPNKVDALLKKESDVYQCKPLSNFRRMFSKTNYEIEEPERCSLSKKLEKYKESKNIKIKKYVTSFQPLQETESIPLDLRNRLRAYREVIQFSQTLPKEKRNDPAVREAFNALSDLAIAELCSHFEIPNSKEVLAQTLRISNKTETSTSASSTKKEQSRPLQKKFNPVRLIAEVITETKISLENHRQFFKKKEIKQEEHNKRMAPKQQEVRQQNNSNSVLAYHTLSVLPSTKPKSSSTYQDTQLTVDSAPSTSGSQHNAQALHSEVGQRIVKLFDKIEENFTKEDIDCGKLNPTYE